MIESARSEQVIVGLWECGQAAGVSKPCASTAAFPQRVSGSRAVDNSRSLRGGGVLLVIRCVGVLGVGADAQLDATWQGLADVEAAGALAVVPVEAVPVRTVTGSSGWAAAAVGFAAADVLLAVDDAIRATGPSAEVGAPRFMQGHVNSLHKKHGRVAWSACPAKIGRAHV